MPRTAQRTNRAFKIAHWQDIQRIYTTVTLTGFCHAWALLIVSILIPSALTVLQFLAALHRAGKNGYMGCAVAYELLAPRIALATGRPCSRRTLERGVSALRMLGLLRPHWWTMPDQRIQNGDKEHVIKGTRKVETSSGWKSCQIRILVLTDRAVAMWDRRSRSKGSEILPHFAQFLTPAKLADNPQIDLVDKPTKVEDTDQCAVSSTDDRKERLEQGRSTPPGPGKTAAPPQTGPTVEHQASTVLDSPPHQTKSQKAPGGLEEALTSATCLGDTRNGSNSLRPGTEDPDNAPPTSARQVLCTGSPSQGVSHERPKLPKHAPNKTSWSVARVYLLVELHRALEPYSRREADSIYERARYEMSSAYPWPQTIVDWAYWVGRFALFSPAQRRYHMARDIVPLLKSRLCPTPSEPRRFGEYKASPPAKRIDKTLEPYLKELYNRFCGD